LKSSADAYAIRPVVRIEGMRRVAILSLTFLLTATLMAAIQIGFDRYADSMPKQLWAIGLLIVIPVWPITLVLDLGLGLPLELTHGIQGALASVFWGLVATFVAFVLSRRRQTAVPHQILSTLRASKMSNRND
jgi:hypothetical protein